MAKTAKAKAKIENGAIASGDCRQAIHWYTNWLGQEASRGKVLAPALGCGRGLFASNFEEDDQLLLDAALTNLEGLGVSSLVIKGDQLYQQADQIWNLALAQAKYGQPAETQLETDMKNCPLLVLSNLSTPVTAQQLWYFYHYVLYPRAVIGKPVLFSTLLGFDEFVMFGAGCDDFEYAGRRLTWEKVVWLLSATSLNLNQCKLLQTENLPVMLQPEYRLFRALQERHLNAVPQQVVGKYMLDFAISDQSARTKINIECDLIHSFSPQQKERDTALTKEGWQVLRISYKEITGDLEDCADAVEELCTGSAKKSTAGRSQNLSMFSYKVNLPFKDKEQLSAISHPGGPAAITGGAGTGKSTCLAQRIAFLVSQGVSPERILMITYSPDTVQLVKSAVGKLIAEPLIDRVNFYTWHDLGLRIIKEHVSAIKRKLPIKIESNPQKVLQKLIAKHSKELDSTALELCGELDEAKAASMISLYKANLVSPQMAKDQAKTEAEKLLARVYASYEEQLQKSNKIDKDDMVCLAAQMLGQDIELRTLYEGLFEHVMVDEYQDATVACDFLARVLAFPNDNLILVGNEDEAMFASSGAAPGLLSETSIRLPETTCYTLQKNWRSHPEITQHAEQFAEYMARARMLRPDKHPFIEKKTISGWGVTTTPALMGPYTFTDQASEGDWIADQIEKLLAQGRKLDDIAVVCRSEDQLSKLQEKFSERGLIVSSVSPDSHLVPDESADVIAFLKLVVDPDGPKAREYFERICQLRSKTVAPKLSATIAGFAEANNLSYLKAVEIYSEAVADPICQDLEQLVKIIRAMHQNKLPPAQIINLLKRPQWLGGYYRSIKVMPGVKYEPLQIISEMHDEALSYRTVADFLKNYSPPNNLHRTLDSDQPVLNLLSIAGVKGREFQIVFVPGLTRDIIPNPNAADQEEERHIFYICLTRARELLFLSCPMTINDRASAPSPFLKEAGLAEKTRSEPTEEDRDSPAGFAGLAPPADAGNREPHPEIVGLAAIDPSLVIPPMPADVNDALSHAVAQNRGTYAPPYAPAPAIPTDRVGLNEANTPKQEPPAMAPKELLAIESSGEVIEEFMARPIQEANQANLQLAVDKVRQAKLDHAKRTKEIPPGAPVHQKSPGASEWAEQPVPPASSAQAGQVPVAKMQPSPSLPRPPIRIEQAMPPAAPGLLAPWEIPPKPLLAGPNAAPPAPPSAPPPVQPLPPAKGPATVPKCNTCQAPLDPDVRFCGECGADQALLKRICRSCGLPLEDLSNFCGECGAAQ